MIATSGGRFDRSEAPIFFAASVPNPYANPGRHLLFAVNDLYGQGIEDDMKRFLDDGYAVLLDSGIFNLTNEYKRATGCTMDEALSLAPEEIPGFNRLFDRYVELATTYGDQLWGYIELDQGGATNKRRTRQRLHDLGLNPIPVYHPFNDGWDYFDELASGYDRLCFGNVVQASSRGRMRLLHTMWERRRQYPHLWIHMLGFSANEWCLPCPPDSCDSSSWLNPLRYPAVRTETAALRSLSALGHRFQYVIDDGTEEYYRGRALVADSMIHAKTVWTSMQGRQQELGAIPHPPRHPDEGELTWA